MKLQEGELGRSKAEGIQMLNGVYISSIKGSVNSGREKISTDQIVKIATGRSLKSRTLRSYFQDNKVLYKICVEKWSLVTKGADFLLQVRCFMLN